jgi:hypothetical protein
MQVSGREKREGYAKDAKKKFKMNSKIFRLIHIGWKFIPRSLVFFRVFRVTFASFATGNSSFRANSPYFLADSAGSTEITSWRPFFTCTK